ncbi:MAG: hypothetical protein P5702_02050 [Limnospira sp. PMC 1291.21]|uniref:hypothetical protein n=1 Tax=Limnospira TaxID=2596745 RepID=UPI00165880C1|nr:MULTISPECIES: hypothetical protein [Limnospira]MDT9176315.1 hypothetical protein [Limnospira sp. PMC 1238.20]MDT9191712.1 hypothetical protein [Limnospira sp. PMC 1245.20]MDT9196696.1 hypothetical protein [Limnospira sp. PMC 1042.18]MDT9201698.1 hypothetical protein [Limnospira sp. PMC 1243.20]MDT9207120.1 hypothetical protein [Limnospira sp. PMC 1252.20]
MDTYVQSRGISKDYCWLDQNQRKISDLPENFKRMLKMVDGDYFALVIYRANGQLSLLVTALKSQNRIDNQTRKICNSVVWAGWVGQDSDEAILRSLAIQALNGELAAKVDPAVISENNAQGFTVNFDLLKPKNIGVVSVQNNPADSEKIGNLSALKDELIGDLKKYALPKHDGMLVVVGSTVSKSSLEEERVWRGLSDQISDDSWIDLPGEDDKSDNFRRQSSSSNRDTNISSKPEKSKSGTASTPSSGLPKSFSASRRSDQRTPEDSPLKKWMPIIIAFVIGSLIGIVGHYLYHTNIPNRQRSQIEQNQKIIDGQQETIDQNKGKIDQQNDTIAQNAETIKNEDKLIKEMLDYLNEFTQKGSPLIKRVEELVDKIQK